MATVAKVVQSRPATPGPNPRRDTVLAYFFWSSTCFGPALGSAPLPLFEPVIHAPVRGRADSRAARLFFLGR